MTHSKAKKTLIFSSVVFILSAIVFVGGILFLNNRVDAIHEIEVQAANEKASIEALQNIENVIKENFENIENINSYFIQPEEEVNFIKDIEAIASSTVKTFDIKSFSHQEIPKNDKYEYAVMQAEATGTFAEIYKFLLIIESYPKESNIKQLEMQKISGSSQSSSWKISFLFQALKSK